MNDNIFINLPYPDCNLLILSEVKQNTLKCSLYNVYGDAKLFFQKLHRLIIIVKKAKFLYALANFSFSKKLIDESNKTFLKFFGVHFEFFYNLKL